LKVIEGNKMENSLELSVVIPIYNEEENIVLLYNSLKKVLDRLEKKYEIILVDDGSTDKTFSILKELAEKDKNLVVISFRRNFGQTAALAAGFEYCRGKFVITMDADLQNDPEDIPKLLEKAEEYDIVSGWRKNRKDSFLFRTLPSKIANFLISYITGVKLNDYGCTLKVYKREVVKNLKIYGEMHRFIPAIASWMGISVIEVETTHHKRRFGKSKYGISRTIRVLLDLITVKFLLSYSTRPIQFFGTPGFLMGGVGFLILLYLTFIKLFLKENIGNRPLLLLGILLILVGTQLIFIGLLGEMIVRIYHEGQNKPIYVIKEIING
jgi:glycosyltransferase involved in cell wall biosynthesis